MDSASKSSSQVSPSCSSHASDECAEHITDSSLCDRSAQANERLVIARSQEPALSRRQLLKTGLGALGTLAAVTLPGCGTSREPQVSGLRYRVREGDSLSGIARATGLSLRDLIDANPHLRGSQIGPGDTLLLPGITALPQANPEPEHVATTPVMAVQPRSVWGAKPIKPNHDPMNGIRRITLHHTSEHPGMMGLNDREVISKIAYVHRDINGWADIGYHYLIGKDGTVYQGRSLTAQGAHAGGDNNKHNLGITMIGDFMHQMPTGRQAQAVDMFLRQQMRRYRVNARQLYAHRDLKNTLCPGDKGYEWFLAFKRRQTRLS